MLISSLFSWRYAADARLLLAAAIFAFRVLFHLHYFSPFLPLPFLRRASRCFIAAPCHDKTMFLPIFMQKDDKMPIKIYFYFYFLLLFFIPFDISSFFMTYDIRYFRRRHFFFFCRRAPQDARAAMIKMSSPLLFAFRFISARLPASSHDARYGAADITRAIFFSPFLPRVS